jgi:hypothetical protein
VETTGLLLTDGKGNVRFVAYPEAAVWDLVSRGYRDNKVIAMMQSIASLDVETTKHLVLDSLENWTQYGFLYKETHHG